MFRELRRVVCGVLAAGLLGCSSPEPQVQLLIAALFIVFPTGQWFGLDRRLHARYPASPWFR